jgi:hypothetical protein
VSNEGHDRHQRDIGEENAMRKPRAVGAIRSGATIALILVSLVSLPSCQTYFREKREAEVLAADSARMRAMVGADESALYLALHTGLTYIHSNGNVDTKHSLMDAIVTGRVDYRRIEPGQRIVGFHGHLGVVTGPVGMEVGVEDRVLDLNSTYTAIYWYEGRRWQLATYKSRLVELPDDSR